MAKTKGRPPLEPRIAALEARMAELEQTIGNAIDFEKERLKPLAELKTLKYVPLFERWPGNGS